MASMPKSFFTPTFIAIFLAVFLLSVLMNAGAIPFDLRLRAQYVPADIRIQTKETSNPLDLSFVHAFSQGGEEPSDMIGPVVDKVKLLHPTYIRIDHVYDFYHIVSRQGGQLVLDFSALDTTVNSILATGALPLFSLSYMPGAIARDGNLINTPLNWDEWAFVVQKTIEHYSGTSGKNIANVYYEIWNEPDHEQFGGWKTYGDKNYLTLYKFAASGAAQATNTHPFKLGGPSTTALYRDWIKQLLSTGARVDFLSWHSYDKRPSKVADELVEIKEWLSAFPQYAHTELVVSEFGFTSSKDSRYWTQHASAHTAAAVRQLLDNHPTHLFNFELKDGPADTVGEGWGVLTHEQKGAIVKPRFSLFPFLDQMKGNRLTVQGEGSRVTGFATSEGDTTQVFLVNFDPDKASGETFPLTFEGLVEGVYRFRQQYFLGVDATVQETISSDSFKKLIFLSANGIVLLELTRTGDLPPVSVP